MSRTHELKADPIPFGAVVIGVKRCEVRQDDRDYQVGDRLHLREHDRASGTYSGRECIAKVTHIQRGYGLPDGLVVLSIDVLASNVAPGAQGEGA